MLNVLEELNSKLRRSRFIKLFNGSEKLLFIADEFRTNEKSLGKFPWSIIVVDIHVFNKYDEEGWVAIDYEYVIKYKYYSSIENPDEYLKELGSRDSYPIILGLEEYTTFTNAYVIDCSKFNSLNDLKKQIEYVIRDNILNPLMEENQQKLKSNWDWLDQRRRRRNLINMILNDPDIHIAPEDLETMSDYELDYHASRI